MFSFYLSQGHTDSSIKNEYYLESNEMKAKVLLYRSSRLDINKVTGKKKYNGLYIHSTTDCSLKQDDQ